MSNGEYFICSYGCVATTDSQCIGTIRDLPSDELGKMLQLLQKQSEAKKERTMKCDNCGNQATMRKHYEKSDGTFVDSYLCGKCFADKFLHYDSCQGCGNFITSIPYIDNQGQKYCSFDCVKRFMGYEDDVD